MSAWRVERIWRCILHIESVRIEWDYLHAHDRRQLVILFHVTEKLLQILVRLGDEFAKLRQLN
jgi:hypothetical protein